jgi:hypothetical protein
MKLPNGDKADLGNKIEQYCLNFNHEKGKYKAILFKAKLGITIDNADYLKNTLKKAAINENVTIFKTNNYGVHYNMKIMIKTDIGESLLLVGWIICKGEKNPQLTNCYPLKSEVKT